MYVYKITRQTHPQYVSKSTFFNRIFPKCMTNSVIARKQQKSKQEAFEKCWAHSPLRAAARRIAIHQVSLLSHARRLRIDDPQQQRRRRQQRQRVTEGTAMAPWNGPDNRSIIIALYCTGIAVLIVWTIGRVSVLCTAFLCLSNWLMLLYTLYYFITVLAAQIKWWWWWWWQNTCAVNTTTSLGEERFSSLWD